MKKVPWQIKAVIFIDIVLLVWSTVGILVFEKIGVQVISLVLVSGYAIQLLVDYGLWKGNKIALLVETVIILFGIIKFPIGTFSALIRLYLLVNRESTMYFGIVRKVVSKSA